MDHGKRQHTKLFFKLLLLAVYFGFFTVQLFLRYTSSHSQQSLYLDSYQKDLTQRSFAIKTVLSKDEIPKSRSLSYLNKRFHPKDNVILPDLALQIKIFYITALTKFYFVDGHVAGSDTHTLFLRGPPAIC
jgi:hypothetical protein